jgi:hypothetical protein
MSLHIIRNRYLSMVNRQRRAAEAILLAARRLLGGEVRRKHGRRSGIPGHTHTSEDPIEFIGSKFGNIGGTIITNEPGTRNGITNF